VKIYCLPTNRKVVWCWRRKEQRAFATKLLLIATALGSSMTLTGASPVAPQTVLVELFTSEGCSSCPPADRLLSALHKASPDIIVLGEHVDYWNSLGWKDPFSSQESTRRQLAYCQKLSVSSPYTPQVVIDGKYECVGSNQSGVTALIAKADHGLAVPVDLQVSVETPRRLTAKVSFSRRSAASDILLFLVQDGMSVDVASGENGGRRLFHDGVVRSIKRLHQIRESMVATADFSLAPDSRLENMRLVAVIEGENGPCGAAQRSLENR